MLKQILLTIGICLAAIILVCAGSVPMAQAGPGTYAVEAGASPSGGTFYANSPSGTWTYKDRLGGTHPLSDSGTALKKFVDSLPGLGKNGCTLGMSPNDQNYLTDSCHENNLGNYIPVAAPVTTLLIPWGITGNNAPPSDYYELDTVEYTQKLHRSLPDTHLRGYKDLGNNQAPRYLGPVIIATKDRPVRLKVKNSLSTNLPLPVDTTLMGAGDGPPIHVNNLNDGTNGTPCVADPGTGALDADCVRYTYSQKRTAVHLHGGHTPWISDGTPHQWFTPAVDASLPPLDLSGLYTRGASFQNVPDMCFNPGTFVQEACVGATPANIDPGPGYQTLYYTNQQSARLMFYHDHAFGITRLNVYAGIAAGYLIVDPYIEAPLIDGVDAGVLPKQLGIGLYRYGIPLVIQDKTFVPQDVAVQDAKWSTLPNPGAYGDLWFPHVYETNQDPFAGDHGGANNFGRWDYGPWFWPPLIYCPVGGPFLNCVKPVADGTAVPYWNLTATPESFADTPLVNGTAYPYLDVTPEPFRFRILNAANDRPFNLQMYVADPNGYGINAAGATVATTVNPRFGTEVAMLPAALWPDCTAASAPATPQVPSTCTCTSFAPAGCFPATWPTDGRAGGVPDPQYAGPKFVQIGNESGWLPSPVIIDNQPVSYDYNRRNIVVLDILDKSLLMGPAERADVIVDFSAFAGKTIILYNDAPAPMPAFDVRYDFFTNNPDQMGFGGTPPTLPGYGPNTRTIMQFRVASAINARTNVTPLYNDTAKMAVLTTKISKAFYDPTDVRPNVTVAPPPIIPESTNVTGATDVYGSIFDTSLTFTPVGSSSSMMIGTRPKAIQELWDGYGRMNATLGVELPFTNNVIQTTIPLGYNDPVTERMVNDEIQIWKITHNGVDTHPVHFHLTDVQLINRVGWDGAIRPPDANEVGWKETVRMKPLEDVFVALRPKLPVLPFTLPISSRLHDPTEPLNAPLALVSPITGGPVTGVDAKNAVENFGHEFVWHCHILGHEENDFMRPIVFTVPTLVPAAPVLDAVTPPTLMSVTLVWSDPSDPLTALNPATSPATSFIIQRSTNNFGNSTDIATVANTIDPITLKFTYTDTNFTAADAGVTFYYRIVGINSKGSSAASSIQSAQLPAVATTVEFSLPADAAKFIAPTDIAMTANVTPGTNATVNRVDFFVNGTRIKTVLGAGPAFSYTWIGAPAGTYALTAKAFNVTNSVSTLLATSVIPVSVTVEALTPTLISPTISVANTTFDYIWTKVTGVGAITYDIYVSLGSTAPISSTVPTVAVVAATCTNNGINDVCRYTNAALTANPGAYIWTVRANDDGASNAGPWATANTFTKVADVPTTTSLDFRNNTRPILTPASQLPHFQNVIPNALADYYTYQPYNQTDAVSLSFPNTCGVSEDCYTITAKRFYQQLAIPDVFGGGQGLKDEFSNYFGPLNPVGANQQFTDAYGYGSGGTNWTPPGGVSVTGNAPAGPLAGGIWHWPAPTIKATKGRPVRVSWLNELPNQIIPGLDPTLNCGATALNCYPYNRIVTHVHGAHVGPESDGWMNSWYTDSATNIQGSDWVSTAGSNDALKKFGPEYTYKYPVDQEASTIWYHDHAVGATHLNTNMGLAGFFLVSDDNEKCLQGTVVNGVCTTPTKVLPTGDYEVGFALQDRTFYTNGQMALPDVPVVDSRDALSCFYTYQTNGDITLTVPANSNCQNTPLFMKAADGHLIPYNAVTITNTLAGQLNELAPFLATSTTLEYFGNMPVVNGVPYGTYTVEPRVYRMRFIGGTDSRTWIMELRNRTTDTIIPFWQIGTEQGFLQNPTKRDSILLMPGERVDVMVDFKNVAPGSQIVMKNLGPDAPYQGEVTPAPSVDIPEIMQFTVGALSNVPDVPSPSELLSLRTDIEPLVATPDIPVRKVSLAEITDMYGRTLPTVDGRGFMMPQTEVIGLNHTEIWEIINTTADAHPMHLHQVAFQLINREAINTNCPADPNLGTLCVTPAVTPAAPYTPVSPYTAPGPYVPASYVGSGTLIPPAPFEAGWKDTIMVPPGTVTRIIAKFDLAGQYTWHCHILSHEENDMARPMLIATAAAKPGSLAVPTSVKSPAAVTVDATATSSVGASFNYVFEYKRQTPTTTDWTQFYNGPSLSPSVTLPDGTYSFRGKAVDSNYGTTVKPLFANSPYTYGNQDLTVSNNYSISVTQSVGGTITPAGTGGIVWVAPGGSQTFTITPTAPYSIIDVLLDGVSQGAVGSVTIANVSANHTITAKFVYTATLGSCINGPSMLATNALPTYSFVVPGFQVSDVFINGVSQGAISSYTYTSGITANQTINAYFVATPPAATPVRLLRAAGGAVGYATIQLAYAAAATGDVIQLTAGTIVGPLTANRPVSVTIRGGYEATFVTRCGPTFLQGGISNVSSGTIRVDQIVLQ